MLTKAKKSYHCFVVLLHVNILVKFSILIASITDCPNILNTFVGESSDGINSRCIPTDRNGLYS